MDKNAVAKSIDKGIGQFEAETRTDSQRHHIYYGTQ